MSFFDRNRKQLAERGIDPERLPPGQYFTDRFPVLHVGDVPTYAADLSDWSLQVGGVVERPFELTWAELLELPTTELFTDIHCVTKWSKFDTTWTGVKVADLFDAGRFGGRRHPSGGPCRVRLHRKPAAGRCAARDVDRGVPIRGRTAGRRTRLPGQAGGAASVLLEIGKWLRGLEATAQNRPGFWERNGYHDYGDPFTEQRYSR